MIGFHRDYVRRPAGASRSWQPISVTRCSSKGIHREPPTLMFVVFGLLSSNHHPGHEVPLRAEGL